YKRVDPRGARLAEDGQVTTAAVEPARDHEIGELADVVVVVMSDEPRGDVGEGDRLAREAPHDAAAGVEDEVLSADLHDRAGRVPFWIRPRPPGAQRNDFHAALREPFNAGGDPGGILPAP